MSLSHIPFQPVHFGGLPDDCGSCIPLNQTNCNGRGQVGGRYSNLVQYNDYTAFQLRLDLCEDATQVLDNPNFANSDTEQALLNPEFTLGANGLESWSFAGVEPSVTAGIVTLTDATNVLFQTPVDFDPSAQYLIEIDVVSVDAGGLRVLSDGVDPTITTSGTHAVIITPTGSALGFYVNPTVTAQISGIRAFKVNGLEDWSVVQPVIVQDQIATIYAGGSISQSGLSPNQTYLFKVNVVGLNGSATISTGAETIQIDSEGVHEFILSTSILPIIAIACQSGSISLQFVEAYEWFALGDIDVEIFNCEDELVYELPAGTKLISSNSLTVNFNWGEILVEDELLPAGCYYLKVTDGCGGTLSSEPFSLATSHPCTYKITACMDSDAFGFEFENFTPTIRLNYKWTDARWPNERSRFVDTIGRSLTNWGKVDEILVIGTDYLPRYIQRFIALWPIFNTIWLGNERYDVDNASMDSEPLEENPTWGAMEIEFKLVNYDLSMSKCSSVVKDCAPPPNCWLWEDGQEIDWEEDINECILYN